MTAERLETLRERGECRKPLGVYLTRWLGEAGVTIGLVAVVGSAWAVTLPYRLSQSQRSVLNIVLFLQVVGPGFVAAFGAAALRGDARSRLLGRFAIVLSAVTVGFLVFFGPYAHSTKGLISR